MTLKRMDNVGVVVDDLAAAIAFFKELGLELEGEAQVEGRSVDRLIGLDGVLSDIAMMRTPDGHGRVELTKFRRPTADRAEPNNAPPNTLGIRRIMFAVEDIDDVVARSAPTVPNWLASWCSTRTIGSVMSVALRASSSRSPRRSADDSGTVESEEAHGTADRAPQLSWARGGRVGVSGRRRDVACVTCASS
jgi:catechol 2,3-dioxygenase-like lactoylglutathione lyase family enzyme